MCLGLANGYIEPKEMTPQEASDYIKEVFNNKFFDGNHKAHCVKEMVLQAFEKQTPKKPKERQGTTYSFCPCCNSNNIYEYCGDCGQKIDWSDTE